MPKIRVYGTRLSPFVEKTVRAINYKGLECEVVEINPIQLRKLNPQTHKIPVVDIDGERLYDSTFILRRLDELRPEPPLFSEDPKIAASQRHLEDWADESLYWYGMGLRWSKANEDASAAVAQ